MSRESKIQEEERFGEELIDVIEKHQKELTNIEIIGTITTVLLCAFKYLSIDIESNER